MKRKVLQKMTNEIVAMPIPKYVKWPMDHQLYCTQSVIARAYEHCPGMSEEAWMDYLQGQPQMRTISPEQVEEQAEEGDEKMTATVEEEPEEQNTRSWVKQRLLARGVDMNAQRTLGIWRIDEVGGPIGHTKKKARGEVTVPLPVACTVE